MANPNAVRQALAEHGIPALVTADKFCRTADQPSPGVGQVVVLPHRPQQRISGPGPARTGGPGPIVIYGSAIPRGVELSIGYRQDSQEYEISFTLIQAGAPLTCTSIPDHGPHPDDGPVGQVVANPALWPGRQRCRPGQKSERATLGWCPRGLVNARIQL